MNTWQAHDVRVWTLAAARSRPPLPPDADADAPPSAPTELELVSGGGDSVLCVWADATAAEDDAARAEREQAVLDEQELFNRMASRDYARTVQLCLKCVPAACAVPPRLPFADCVWPPRLEQPGRLQAVLGELLEVGPLPVGPPDYNAAMLEETLELEGLPSFPCTCPFAWRSVSECGVCSHQRNRWGRRGARWARVARATHSGRWRRV